MAGRINADFQRTIDEVDRIQAQYQRVRNSWGRNLALSYSPHTPYLPSIYSARPQDGSGSWSRKERTASAQRLMDEWEERFAAELRANPPW